MLFQQSVISNALRTTPLLLNESSANKIEYILPFWLFTMRIAEAPAACATFAFVVNLHLPRSTTITSPVS